MGLRSTSETLVKFGNRVVEGVPPEVLETQEVGGSRQIGEDEVVEMGRRKPDAGPATEA